MAFREVLLTVIKPRGCGRLACFNHSVCSGHDTSFNRSSLEDNYLTAAISTDRCLSYANILPSRGSGNENNVISLSAVFFIETMKLLSSSGGRVVKCY